MSLNYENITLGFCLRPELMVILEKLLIIETQVGPLLVVSKQVVPLLAINTQVEPLQVNPSQEAFQVSPLEEIQVSPSEAFQVTPSEDNLVTPSEEILASPSEDNLVNPLEALLITSQDHQLFTKLQQLLLQIITKLKRLMGIITSNNFLKFNKYIFKKI